MAKTVPLEIRLIDVPQVKAAIEEVRGLNIALEAENQQLREENERLRDELTHPLALGTEARQRELRELRELRAENERLRDATAGREDEWRRIGEAVTDHREGCKARVRQLEDAIHHHVKFHCQAESSEDLYAALDEKGT